MPSVPARLLRQGLDKLPSLIRRFGTPLNHPVESPAGGARSGACFLAAAGVWRQVHFKGNENREKGTRGQIPRQPFGLLWNGPGRYDWPLTPEPGVRA
jgi:hypothetical protein